MRKIFFILLILALNLSCENALMDVYNERWDGDPVTFENADTPGDRIMIRVGNERVDFRYANNQSSITFPFSPDWATPVDNNKATLTNKFFMSETEVTNALFAEVLQWARNNGKIVETGGAPNEVSGATVKYGDQELIDLDNSSTNMKISYSAASDTFSVASGYENHSVVCVTWYGAVIFCNWLTEMRDSTADNVVYTGIDSSWVDTETTAAVTKNGYRLLSSEEWEYAARFIGTTVPTAGDLASEYITQNLRGDAALTPGYYWTPADYASGATKDYTFEAETRAVSWYATDPLMEGVNKVMPVAQKRSNQLGIYDMSGNVWEWCFTASLVNRVHRGGCWFNPDGDMQTGYWQRSTAVPASEYVGFRIARTK